MTPEPTLEELSSQVQRAKAKMLETAQADQSWPCPHCGNTRTHTGNIWNPRELREASGVGGPVSMIAIDQLSREGAITFDSSWNVVVRDTAK